MQLVLVRQLDEVVNAHLRWLNRFNHVLVCDKPPDPDDSAPDAHRKCHFGRWYHGLDLSQYRSWQSQLQQIGAIHEKMHTLGAVLLAGPRVPTNGVCGYERFTDAAYRFKTSVRALQFRLMQDVCLVDHLTGIWNRNALHQRLNEEYQRMLRHGGQGCLCMMDLDNFKEVNDRYGHPAGDHALQAVAEVAAKNLRRYDSIFRFGGEEFLFCLPKIGMPDAVAAMERVRIDISTTPVRLPDGREIALTASFGVAEFSPTLSVEENIDVADRALFGAKAAGRNRVCWEDAGD